VFKLFISLLTASSSFPVLNDIHGRTFYSEGNHHLEGISHTYLSYHELSEDG